MRRIIFRIYPDHFEPSFVEKVLGKRSITPKEYEEINTFGRGYFGEYAGYAQEYLFHYWRTRMSTNKSTDSLFYSPFRVFLGPE